MQKGETAAVQQDGQWLVSFAVPREVGRTRPTRATLSMRASLPGHQLVIRKGQCPQGVVRQSSFGETVAAWDRTVGRQETTFDIGPGDADTEGRLWLLIDVHSVGAVAGANPLAWQIQDLGADLEAEVVAPPVSIETEIVTAALQSDQESH
jgi:hypothetical protein